MEDAIADGDAVVFAVLLDTMKELIPQCARLLEGKVVIDPSNPIGFDHSGQPIRTLPEGQSAGSVVAALFPAGAPFRERTPTAAADGAAEIALRQQSERGLLDHRSWQQRRSSKRAGRCLASTPAAVAIR